MINQNETAVFFVKGVFPGSRGGAIFYGENDAGHEISAAIDYKWKGRLPVKGEVWRVEGVKKPFSRNPKTIHVKNAISVAPPLGKLTKQFLCEGEQFRGFGFGASKLDRLEAGLATEGISVRDALNEGQVELMSKYLPVGMVEKLVEAWLQSSESANIYEFLDNYGFDRSLAVVVRRVFKENVVSRLNDNVYRLIAFGTPTQSMWKKAEAAAALLGIGSQDHRRIAASVAQALYDRLADGHTATTLDELKPLVKMLLRTKSDALFEKAIRAATNEKLLVRCGDGLQPIGPASMEARVESRLVTLARLDHSSSYENLFSLDADHLEVLLAQVDEKFTERNGSGLNSEQLRAVRMICSSHLCVVSGGAGTGKTTILRAVHDMVDRTSGTVFQMALAGRAKERLEEATGRKAYTLHAFIEHLKKGKEMPGSKDAVVVEEGAHIIIDEASMVDLTLIHKLLGLLPDKVKICFIGDPGQLPPIGFGVVFHLLVGVEGIRTVELKKIIRQKDTTGIPGISRSVRVGCVPGLQMITSVEAFEGHAEGVFFVSADDNSDIAAVLYVISEKLSFDCQVLCVRRRFGDDSSSKVNRYFQYRLSDAQTCVHLARWGFFVGDPVIVTRNCYELGLFNGTLGQLVRLEGYNPVFLFGDREITLDDEQMVEVGIELAYGITVHKAQGSEFNRVVVPVTESKGLDRSLLYTALTRARLQVVFVGNWQAFARAIEAEPNVSSVSVGFDLRAAMAAKEI
ncbi:hypothetical protein E4633_20225 [Geomonas terrae]|uniref:AAA family ATPase n=1 Tax=Geomonas terrae TaxID=2562681 RepID=A0A4S1C9G8_9BACT|nr:AAA family ATPase [Geomonas terrae]TGU69921.1 hypothetical protein E4633_20225 [Geomonas terrae]